jgi:hypothetical protein
MSFTMGSAISKPKTVADVCIEASEARARILKSCGKGPSKKKQEYQDVNMTDHGDHRDRRYRGNHQQPPEKEKERRLFCHPTDAEKWWEIHRTDGQDLEECKTFLDHKKMPPLAPMTQEP